MTSIYAKNGDNRRTPLECDADGNLKVTIVDKTFDEVTDWAYAAAASGIANTTTAVTIKAAGGAGVITYLEEIDFMAEALGAATELVIRDGAGGAVLWRTKIGTGGLTTGRQVKFTRPLKSTANTLLEVCTLTASSTGAVYLNARGYSE